MSSVDVDKQSSKRAAVGVVLCLLLLAITAVVMVLLRYCPVRYTDVILTYSERYDLEPAFVAAVINAESRYNERAVSSAGASGLMQIMEDTAYWIAPMAGLENFDYTHIFDPEINIRLGCFYLRMYIDRFGSTDTALCAYNAGGGSVESWLADPYYSSDGVTLDIIPFEETHNYVQRVNNYTQIYRVLFRFV